jgi:hypothetical protein
MPTIKPRLNITLETHQHELLKRYADLTGTQMSKVVLDLITPAFEPLERLCVMLQDARNSMNEVNKGISDSFAQVSQEMDPLLIEAMNQCDMFVDRAFDFQSQELPNLPRSVTTGDRLPRPPLQTKVLRG